MRVLQKGNSWGIERICTGVGWGDGGCGAKLFVERADIFRWTTEEGKHRFYFVCLECGIYTDIPWEEIPNQIRMTK